MKKSELRKIIKECYNEVKSEMNTSEELDESNLGELQPIIDWMAGLSKPELAAAVASLGAAGAGFVKMIHTAYKNSKEDGMTGLNRR